MTVRKRNVCLWWFLHCDYIVFMWREICWIVGIIYANNTKRFCLCWTKGAFWACSGGRCWKELKIDGKSVPRLLFREENKGVSPLCQRGKDLFVCLFKHIKMEMKFIFSRRTSCWRSTASVGKFSRFHRFQGSQLKLTGRRVFRANNKRHNNMNISEIHRNPLPQHSWSTDSHQYNEKVQ